MAAMRSHYQNPPQGIPLPHHPDYQPYYCEENIYRLAAQLAAGHDNPVFSILFISNEQQTCALRHQRAAPAGKVVVWDYHVIMLLARGSDHWVLDPDSRLGLVTPAGTYLQETFGLRVDPSLRPRFRRVAGTEFLDSFSTDRRHMRAEGRWLQPPPTWEPPCGPRAASPHELPRFRDTTGAGPGRLSTLPELTQKLAGSFHLTRST